MIRYIIRPPNIKSTPKRLQELFSAKAILNGAYYTYPLNWNKDFFLYYPKVHWALGAEYYELAEFQWKHKAAQREYLRKFFKTPEDYPAHEGKYVIRPLRHHSGQGWELNDTESSDPKKYSSPLFPKKHEYRILFTKGHKIATLKKRHPPEQLSCNVPWGHSNGTTFVTVNNDQNDRLRHTSVYEDAVKCPIIMNGHLTGLDVMYSRINDKPAYAVLEINLCPSMSIEKNLVKLKDLVSSSEWINQNAV